MELRKKRRVKLVAGYVVGLLLGAAAFIVCRHYGYGVKTSASISMFVGGTVYVAVWNIWSDE